MACQRAYGALDKAITQNIQYRKMNLKLFGFL